MDLQTAVEWLARYNATVVFESLPNNITRVKVTARDHTSCGVWSDIEQKFLRESIQCRTLINMVERLDHTIGS